MIAERVLESGDLVIRVRRSDPQLSYVLCSACGTEQIWYQTSRDAERIARAFATFARVNLWTDESGVLSLLAAFRVPARHGNRPEPGLMPEVLVMHGARTVTPYTA
jgi:hypothetical protein